jgi:hypothetical protein
MLIAHHVMTTKRLPDRRSYGYVLPANIGNDEGCVQKPPLDPDISDVAPTSSRLTRYDEEHIITYMRLLDAESEGADWRESCGDCFAHRSSSRAGSCAYSLDNTPGARSMHDERRLPGPIARRMERAMGIEPTFVAWEATVLPLDDARD